MSRFAKDRISQRMESKFFVAFFRNLVYITFFTIYSTYYTTSSLVAAQYYNQRDSNLAKSCPCFLDASLPVFLAGVDDGNARDGSQSRLNQDLESEFVENLNNRGDDDHR